MKFIIFAIVVAAIVMGGLIYNKQTGVDKIAVIKQACIQKYTSLPENNLINDVDGFCQCQAEIKRPATIEEAKAGGIACMDQYGKENMLKLCESMNADMQKEDPASKGLNCSCFYDNLMNLFGDMVLGQNGADNMTKQQRDETIGKAFVACRN